MPDLGICKLKLIFLCEGFDHVEILRIFKSFLKISTKFDSNVLLPESRELVKNGSTL